GAKAEPDDAGGLYGEIGQQPLIERCDVARVAHPVRPLRLAVAGMVRHDDVELFGQRVIERQAVGRADIVVQHENRPSLMVLWPAAPQAMLDLAQLHPLLIPRDGHNPRPDSLDSPQPSPAILLVESPIRHRWVARS